MGPTWFYTERIMLNIHTKAALLYLCLITLVSCSTIAGPPESETELSIPGGSLTPYDRLVEGQPSQNLMTVRGGIYLWKTGNTWHLRVAKVAHPPMPVPREPVFSGSIRVDNGIITTVIRQNLDLRSRISQVRSEVTFDIEPRINVQTDVQGFDLHIRPTTGNQHCVNLDFSMNGARNPGIVHLGSGTYAPDALPLTLCYY